MNYGFNTFCTKEWVSVVEILAESISLFSKYPLIINCINFNHNFKDPKIITKTINADIGNLSHVYRYKWSSLLTSDFDITVMLDADMIALPHIDNLFYENNNLISIKNLLIFKVNFFAYLIKF
jgi:hypothetical protein